MSLRSLGGWALLLAVGCDGRLIVDRGGNSVSGMSGASDVSGVGTDMSDGPIEAVAGMTGGAELAGGDGGGGSAGTVIPPDAGKVGETCLPEGLVTESEGSATEATIRVLARCDAGLSCNAQGKCAAAPDCLQGHGVCVMRRAVFDQYVFDGLDGIAHGHTGVLALAASDSHVYWLEYGTRDALGTYQHDGTLMSYRIADGTTTSVASGFDGPTSLALTTTHAYIASDGILNGHPQAYRAPLTGGSVEQLQQDQFSIEEGFPAGFTAAGSQAFWSTSTGIYTQSASSNAVPTPFSTEGSVYPLMSDGTEIFYTSPSSGFAVIRTPIASPAPQFVATSSGFGIALHGDDLFELDVLQNGLPWGTVLSRAPKSGGEFLRVRPLGAGVPLTKIDALALQVVGDRYFFTVEEGVQDSGGNYGTQRRVLSASFADDDPPIRLLELPMERGPDDRFRWIGTAVGLFWSDGRAIYAQPLPSH